MTQHIAFVVTNYPPRVGGVEKHVGALATRLAARGHRVSVFTLSDEPGTAREDGVLVRRLPRRPLPRASQPRLLAARRPDRGPDRPRQDARRRAEQLERLTLDFT